jgi:hypothetical protein
VEQSSSERNAFIPHTDKHPSFVFCHLHKTPTKRSSNPWHHVSSTSQENGRISLLTVWSRNVQSASEESKWAIRRACITTHWINLNSSKGSG